ncbi:MAG: hypothetical protein WAJ92_07280 [Candidatus Acidiferrales bacterium]
MKKSSCFNAKGRLPRLPVLTRLVLCLLAVPAGIITAQAPVYQRIVPRSVAEVQAYVQTMRATSSGRLPTLEGFVQETDQPLDHFERGYYECTFQVAPAVGGGTLVQATAKITAWYTDPVPARSGYRVLVSNGRLENDFLDRIEEAVAPGRATAPAPAAPPSLVPSSPAANTGGLRPAVRLDPAAAAPGSDESSLESSSSSSADSSVAPRSAPVSPAAPLPAGESVESIKAQREADEKRALDLTSDVKNLQEILHNQSRPVDLVAVKHAKTPVFAKPAEGSPVLLAADVQDEFQILGVEGSWVHVQISGAARGWMRRSQLEMPPGYLQASDSADHADSASPSPSAPMFKLAKEETSPFSGTWALLKGKTVRIEWVEPSSPSATTSGREKLAFAKSTILRSYAALVAANQSVEGIVVVFDSADGGQIAATISSVKALADGSLSPTAFWRQCSLDPAESFQESAK